MLSIRKILRAGSVVFGFSALLLIIFPTQFLQLLALDDSEESLQWAMRMIGITLVALAGNMWFNSNNTNDAAVRTVGIVMAFSATALGILTILIPAEFTWFTILYALVGFSFGAAYLYALLRNKI